MTREIEDWEVKQSSRKPWSEDLLQFLRSNRPDIDADWKDIGVTGVDQKAAVSRARVNDTIVEMTAISAEHYEGDLDPIQDKLIESEDVMKQLKRLAKPAATTEEIAEELNCTTELIKAKLDDLYQEGKVDRRESAESILWWPTKEQEALLRGFGAFEGTDLPGRMREERERAREEWQ